VHGPSGCAFAMRVKDAAEGLQRALELGAKPPREPSGRWSSTSRDPGHRRKLIYLVDPLPGQQRRPLDLRRRLPAVDGRRATSQGRGAHRRSTTSRTTSTRAHGHVGALLREVFNFRADPLLRHPAARRRASPRAR
jgi:hypothetical protein